MLVDGSQGRKQRQATGPAKTTEFVQNAAATLLDRLQHTDIHTHSLSLSVKCMCVSLFLYSVDDPR